MADVNFIFQISPYDTEKLLPQVSMALEKRMELVSREQYPGMWRYTDKFNSMAQGRTRSRLRTRFLSIVCIAVGIFLFVPGLVKPQELLVPLLAGAVAIGAGIGGVWRSRKHKKNPFDKSAKILLAGKDSISKEQTVTVSFSADGMTIPVGDGNTEFVPYSDFECVIETTDILLLVYGERVTVLQKMNLTTGNINDFVKLISEKVVKVMYISRNTLHTLPTSIQKIIGDRPYTLNDVGMSDSQIICFEDMVLKIERQREESDNEYRMMQWLSDKLPVPKVLAFERQEGVNYLMMSRMEGEMSCNEQLMQEPQQLVQLLAAGLKQLWQVDISDCPYQNASDNKLRLARERVNAGLCSTEDVEPDTYGENGFADPEELLQWLRDHQPEEDLVFSHGDYCLPNIFIRDGRVSGFIDLGRSGVADRYQDIALCYRSLKHNYAGEYGGKVHPDFRPESLFEALGIEPDWDKIRYYNLMDELF